MLSIRVAALAACAAALAPTPTATPRQRLGTRRSFGGFKLPNIENPFDDRPGATVGKLQIALANEDMSATRVVADCAARFERDRSRAALPKFIADVATSLARRADAWLYAASVGERFDPGRVERYDHETAYENLVNAEAAKFEEERTPSSAELERTSEGVRGMCVVSIVVCLEGDETELFADAAASEPRLRTALRDLATRCGVQGGDLVYNAEVLWTPSSADGGSSGRPACSWTFRVAGARVIAARNGVVCNAGGARQEHCGGAGLTPTACSSATSGCGRRRRPGDPDYPPTCPTTCPSSLEISSATAASSLFGPRRPAS